MSSTSPTVDNITAALAAIIVAQLSREQAETLLAAGDEAGIRIDGFRLFELYDILDHGVSLAKGRRRRQPRA